MDDSLLPSFIHHPTTDGTIPLDCKGPDLMKHRSREATHYEYLVDLNPGPARSLEQDIADFQSCG